MGAPPQSVRLFPGTSATASNTLWVVLSQGCSAPGDPGNCAYLRGFEFTPNQSSTWSIEGLGNEGLYSLVVYEESLLGYSGNAYYGYDSITLGWPGQGTGLPSITHQVVAGIATPDFYLGSLGLSPIPMNFSSLNDPQPSMLSTLRNKSVIPSSSWGYTAGAFYQQPPVFGSLTLGGCDTTRFISNNLTIPFGADQSRDLLVAIQSITSETVSHPLLPKGNGVYAFIDSLVPHIWLPIEVCAAFEQAFNLSWDVSVELYLLTDDQHRQLVKQNTSVTFRLGASATDDNWVDIIMPYGSFDLAFSSLNSSIRYFPLKRAQNDTQYTLGRVFLQQAYVIADYERHNFSISQAVFPNSSVSPKIVPIFPPNHDQGPHSLNGSNLAGIIVGSLSAIIIIAIAWMYWRHFKKRQLSLSPAKGIHEGHVERETGYQKPELDAIEPSRVEIDTREIPPAELTESCLVINEMGLCGSERPVPSQELAGQQISELSFNPVCELPAAEVPVAELES